MQNCSGTVMPHNVTFLSWFVHGFVSLNEHKTIMILIEVDLVTTEVNVASFVGGDGDEVPTTCQLIQRGELLAHMGQKLKREREESKRVKGCSEGEQ